MFSPCETVTDSPSVVEGLRRVAREAGFPLFGVTSPDLPAADLQIDMRAEAQGRNTAITAHTEVGRRCLDKLTY